MKLGCSLDGMVVFGAGSPSNLVWNLANRALLCGYGGGSLVWHHHKEALPRILVGLDLVVGRLDAGAAGEEEQELRGRVRVVAGLRDVDLISLRLAQVGHG